MLPSTKFIEAFEAAARRQSFGAAARELNITSSAISHRIARLERMCGVSLFRREVRQVRLTPDGVRLLVDARKTLDALTAFAKSAAPTPVRISTTPMFGLNIILPRLERFHNEHPDIHVQIEMAIIPESIDTCDAVIRFEKLVRREWISREILTAQLVPVQSKDASFGTQIPVPLINYSYSQSTWRGVIPEGTSTEAEAMVVSGMAEAIAAVKSGHGVALVPEPFIREDLKSGAIVRLPHWRSKKGTFYFCHRKHGESLAVRTFGGWLRDNLQDS